MRVIDSSQAQKLLPKCLAFSLTIILKKRFFVMTFNENMSMIIAANIRGACIIEHNFLNYDFACNFHL